MRCDLIITVTTIVSCSLRALYGRDLRQNGIHCSDTCEEAQHEIRFFFHDSQLASFYTLLAWHAEQGLCNGWASVRLSVCPVRPPHTAAAISIDYCAAGGQQQPRRSSGVRRTNVDSATLSAGVEAEHRLVQKSCAVQSYAHFMTRETVKQ